MPEHARIVHQGGGKLLFVNGPGVSFAAGRQLGPGEQAAFDFRTQFAAGRVPIPLHHPAITLSVLTTSTLNAPPGQPSSDGEPFAVTFVQRFNSTLGCIVHFHVLVPDGLFRTDAAGAARVSRRPLSLGAPFPDELCRADLAVRRRELTNLVGVGLEIWLIREERRRGRLSGLQLERRTLKVIVAHSDRRCLHPGAHQHALDVRLGRL